MTTLIKRHTPNTELFARAERSGQRLSLELHRTSAAQTSYIYVSITRRTCIKQIHESMTINLVARDKYKIRTTVQNRSTPYI